jgi:hypothetical protein
MRIRLGGIRSVDTARGQFKARLDVGLPGLKQACPRYVKRIPRQRRRLMIRDERRAD